MRIIALDSSTDWLSVAVGDGREWHARDEYAGQSHSQRALPLVKAVLAAAGWTLASVDGIAFGAGPGSFTGIRLACGLAQGLALATDRPVVPVPTLAALAHAAWAGSGQRRVVVCLDARMREVYVAAYARADNEWREVAAPTVTLPAAIAGIGGSGWFGAGNGFRAYPELATLLALDGCDADVRPSARDVAELALPRLAAGEGVAADEALPLYVRHRVALTSAERAAGARL